MRRPESNCGRRVFLCGLSISVLAAASAAHAEDKALSLDELQTQLKSEKRAVAAAAFAELEGRAASDAAAQKVLDAYRERRQEFFERCQISSRSGYFDPAALQRDFEPNEVVILAEKAIPLDEMHLIHSLPPLHSLVVVSPHFTDQHLSFFAGVRLKHVVLEKTQVTGKTLGEVDFSELKIAWFTGSPLVDKQLKGIEFPQLGQLGVSDTALTNQFLKEVRAREVGHFNCAETKLDAAGLRLLATAFPELKTLQIGIKLATKENVTSLFADNRNLSLLTIRCALADFDQVVDLKPAAKGRLAMSVPGLNFTEAFALRQRFEAAQPKAE